MLEPLQRSNRVLGPPQAWCCCPGWPAGSHSPALLTCQLAIVPFPEKAQGHGRGGVGGGELVGSGWGFVMALVSWSLLSETSGYRVRAPLWRGWPWPGGCGAAAQGSPVRGLLSGLASGAWATGQLWSLWNANPGGLAAGPLQCGRWTASPFPPWQAWGVCGRPAGDRASAAASPAVVASLVGGHSPGRWPWPLRSW